MKSDERGAPKKPLSAARARTLDRMHRLIGLAALGAAACSSGSTDNGYAVVDPMPTPARCAGGANSIHGTAAFEMGPEGRVLVIRLAPPVDTGTTYVAPEPGDTSFHLEGGGLEARVVPTAGALSYALSVRIQCAEGPASATANVSWPSADVAPGTPLAVQVSAAY